MPWGHSLGADINGSGPLQMGRSYLFLKAIGITIWTPTCRVGGNWKSQRCSGKNQRNSIAVWVLTYRCLPNDKWLLMNALALYEGLLVKKKELVNKKAKRLAKCKAEPNVAVSLANSVQHY